MNTNRKLIVTLLLGVAAALPASAQGVLESLDDTATHHPSPSFFGIGISSSGVPCPGPTPTLAFCDTDPAATSGTDVLLMLGSLEPPLAVPIPIGSTLLDLQLDPLSPLVLNAYGLTPFGGGGLAVTPAVPIAGGVGTLGLVVHFQGLRVDLSAQDFVGNTNVHSMTLTTGC